VENYSKAKSKVQDEHAQKHAQQKQRKDYASSVKKPKIDENQRLKLINEIKNPTTFMGR